tara:strand:- start:4040 stop:4405 length:366 start_codon:yes stop_codon:yes gene_type:complete
MASEIATDIVNKIFADDKAAALDQTNTALSAASYDLVQATKADWAQKWGYDPAQTGQAAADELSATLPDGTNQVKDYDPGERQPHEPPEDEAPGTPSSVEPEASAETETTPEEETNDEANS